MTSQWALGHALEERLSSLRLQGVPTEVDEARARRRLERWRKQEPLTRDVLWDQRLRAAGLTEAELHALLGESSQALHARMGAPPSWQRVIERAYAQATAPRFSWPEPTPPGSALLGLVEPLVHEAHARLIVALDTCLREAPEAPFEPERTARMLLGPLPRQLMPLLGRTLAVELRIAQLEGRLQGDTSEARFQDFAHQLRRRDVALDVLSRYPVMARQAVELIAGWEAAGVELMQRLARDAAALWRRFHSGVSPGLLVEAQGGLSDPHRGGRTVFLLRFASGLRLVYKPRPLAAEAAFQQLVSWLNARGLTPPLRTVEFLSSEGYGWMEFVEAAPCQSADEVRRFHLRQGALVALLYALDVTDIHYENLIAAGEHPVLVDLETLFHPHTLAASLQNLETQPGAVLNGTVLKSGLLPQPAWRSKDGTEVDFSALGAGEGQLTPLGYLVATAHGTDELRFERRRMEIPGAANRPRLEGQDLSVTVQADALAQGFSTLYRLLIEHRDALLAPEGPLAAFEDAPVRVLFRGTASYDALLHESMHPHAMGDALDRQRFFDHLWLAVKERPYLAALIPLEQEELQRGDIPRFTTLPGSKDLWSGAGRHLPGFFDMSGLERARQRLVGLSPDDHARQLALLRSALDRVRLAARPGARPRYPFHEPPEPAQPDALLAAARRVGERLVALSFTGAGQAHWLSLEQSATKEWRLAQAGTDLYQGLSGIALVLAQLGALTGEARFTQAARGALRHLTWRLEKAPAHVSGVGLLNGWGGILYALTHLGALWGERALFETAESFVDAVAPRVEQDVHLDLGGGCAGALLGLLTLTGRHPSERASRLARACGEKLLLTATPQPQGLGWPSPATGGRALCGLAHGGAGIALALLRLASATGEARFHAAALETLAYERGQFSPEAGDWPDLRADAGMHGGDGPAFMCGWCNGAPGIGLGRISSLPLLDDARVRGEITAAVNATLAGGLGYNHGLCHGDLGNVLFLLEAARALHDDTLLRRTYQLAGGILQSIESHGHLHGLPDSIETPGLMVGLAGIAHGLARLAAPERVPDVLSVAPPIP
ncbi:type 2 lanthipeptide synthetase LanM family protein [Corallococcus macrosporus]|uniref:Lanthionine synthetase C family protein n=1 Tax=Corallococcus macrosporus DSM 14697 TaxID=1189310 RepID=A0A250K4C6_9BACT|nr:type 2 lanthipeptide synthetase LanM family protein [Corallococcus macrosporus]ATB50461.1 lanthionine synthetase C family protein [Corallococcus macrosporus DSM 14697]